MIFLTFDTQEECDKFICLYEKYHKTVYYTILRFIKDKILAEDILNDIYIRIGENLSKVDLNDPKKCQNFIITISRNYCISYLRKASRINEEFIEDSDVMSDSKGDILTEIIEKELFDRIMKEVHQLDDKYKSVMELKYINGFEDDEIAKFLGLKKKTVQMRLYRAKIMLREKLGVNNNGQSNGR